MLNSPQLAYGRRQPTATHQRAGPFPSGSARGSLGSSPLSRIPLPPPQPAQHPQGGARVFLPKLGLLRRAPPLSGAQRADSVPGVLPTHSGPSFAAQLCPGDRGLMGTHRWLRSREGEKGQKLDPEWLMEQLRAGWRLQDSFTPAAPAQSGARPGELEFHVLG